MRIIETNESCSTPSRLVLDNLPKILRRRQEGAREENWCWFVVCIRIFQDTMGARGDGEVPRQPANRWDMAANQCSLGG